MHAFTAHRFSESQRKNLRTEVHWIHCAFRHLWRYFFQSLRLHQIVFSKRIHLCIVWFSSYITPPTMHAANPIIRVIFNASKERNQTFSRKNDRSRRPLYLRVPVSLLQYKCILDYKWLRINWASVL
jgi:hypothetical protein